jgi:hypothetical protein
MVSGVTSEATSARARRPIALPSNRKPATLSIGQAESPATEFLPENSVLLSEVFDDGVLLATDPAGQGGNEDLPGLEDGGH